MKLIFSLLAAAVALVPSVSLRALTIDFSLTGSLNTGGTASVTGMLTGTLTSDTFNASDVIITSAPAAAGLTLPFDFASTGNEEFGGVFTILNNTVTTAQAEFLVPNQYILDLNNPTAGNDNGLYVLNAPGGAVDVSNYGGFAGASYELIAAPEPSSWALMLFALPMLFLGVSRSRGIAR